MKQSGLLSNVGSVSRYLYSLFCVALMVWTMVLPMPSAAGSMRSAAPGPVVTDKPTQDKPAPSLESVQTSMGDASAYFEENDGQFDDHVKFLARGTGGYDLFLTATDAVYVLHERTADRTPMMPEQHGIEEAERSSQQPQHATAVYMTLSGARRDATFSGTEMLEHKTNYFKGRKEHWRTNIANYRRVETRGIYNGVDMVWHGRERGGVQYDFIVQPGADASQIGWDIRGAHSAEIDAEGSLIIHTDYGDIRQERPYTYQDVNGSRQEVASSFTIDNSTRGDSVAHIGFSLGEYDTAKPLTIDPSVNLSKPSFSTFLGGTDIDEAQSLAVDSADNVYVTGYTYSTEFPTTPGTVDTSHNGESDVFVTKLNAAGTALIYSTYIGGGSGDLGIDLFVDGSGSAYIAGSTTSADFPTTAGAYDPSHNGYSDVFVTKLNTTGSTLTYSTFIGDVGDDYGWGVAVDTAGNAYLTGSTNSANLATTPGAYDTTFNGGQDVFVTKLNATGSAQVYSTFVGGSGTDSGHRIAIDSAGNAYVTGETQDDTTDYPTTSGAPYPTHNGSTDAFVTKLNAAGSALLYSTFLGGISYDTGYGIAVDSSGNAFVTGWTSDAATDYPTTAGAYMTAHNGGLDVFVTKLDAAGSTLTYSTFIGGSGDDQANNIAIDPLGYVFVTGWTADAVTDYPTTAGAYDMTHNGGYDTFVTKLNTTGTALSYSTVIGGIFSDLGTDIAIDSSGNAFVTGYSTGGAPGYPTTPEVFQPEYDGNIDSFVSKFGDYSISGRTVDHLGNALPSSAVALSGDSDGFMLSDSEGYFAFSDTLSLGTYLVSATHLLNNFNPPNYSIQSLNRNKRVTFVGRTITSGPSAALRQLGGAVHSSTSGVGLPFTQMSLVDVFGNIRTTQTDAQGRYVFDNVETGAYYVVFAQRDGYAFQPGTASINFFDEDLGVNFSARPTNLRPVQDFDGDGKTDLAVFRPAEGNWYILRSETNSVEVVRFGLAGDIPVAEDFDGDRRADIAVFRPTDGNWYRLDSSTGAFTAIHFGADGDIPVPADFDGDGKVDLSVYRPDTGVWHRLNSSDGSYTAVKWGIETDIPIPADLDSDGRADITVYRNGTWYRLNSSNMQLSVSQFGVAGDVPVARDFDGDGRPDISVFRPSNGTWHYLNNLNSEYHSMGFGQSGDIPVASDYDGDGRFDAAVFRPSNGTWMLRRSASGTFQQPFGTAGDIPVQSAPIAR
ncbi:MAG: hypothetical protein DCC44_05175 [Acidobacteria bacterium]|nr:hypothetical protein [Pyrinomonadaceae bacterium]RIJ94228.1 MAG: hypothetical protein DCC44_05175 [Acidobacteriota bacterium]